MGFFNHISKLSKSNVQSGNAIFDLVMTDYVKRYDLGNDYNKLDPLTMSNDINMSENKINILGDQINDNGFLFLLYSLASHSIPRLHYNKKC